MDPQHGAEKATAPGAAKGDASEAPSPAAHLLPSTPPPQHYARLSQPMTPFYITTPPRRNAPHPMYILCTPTSTPPTRLFATDENPPNNAEAEGRHTDVETSEKELIDGSLFTRPMPLPPSPFRRHFQEDLAAGSGHIPSKLRAGEKGSNTRKRGAQGALSSIALATILAVAPLRLAFFRFNTVLGTPSENGESSPATVRLDHLHLGMTGGAGGDIIVDGEVWPWQAGEHLEDVFADEGVEVGVVDHRGQRVRRTTLPLVLREGWRLLVADPRTGVVLVYTLTRDVPDGAGRDPTECFGEEIVVRIFSFLDVRALCTAAIVSSSWKRISEDNSLWRERCLREKPFLKELMTSVFEEKRASWRSIYRCLSFPHRWSKDRKPNGIKVTNEGFTAKVKGPTSTNVSVQASRPLKAGAEPFWYFEAMVDRKPPPWNIGFGIADSEWALEIKFVGFDRDSFNYGYTSNGKMRATPQFEGFTTYGQGDRIAFWVEYFYPGQELTLHVFLNGVKVHSWERAPEKHKPPLYFTATLYHDGTQVSLSK